MKNQRPLITSGNTDSVLETQGEEQLVPLRILRVKEHDGNVSLSIKLSDEFYKELYAFLNEKGLTCWGNDKAAIVLLLQFGLSGENEAGLERIKSEMERLASRYASMRFQTSEYYAQNNAVTCGLRQHLRENKMLKLALKEKGLGHYVSRDEWDDWDEKRINELYQLYVLCK